MLRALGAGLLDLLLPRACAQCGRGLADGAPLCAPCAARLPRLPRAACPRCQAPGPTDRGRCPACRRAPGPLSVCLAEVPFAGEAAAWVRGFKYAGAGWAGLDPRAPAVVRWLVRRAARRLPAPPPALVVPVPLHPRRLRRLGFHPAAELAREVGRALEAPCAPHLLVRVRDTASQTGLDRRARARNVADAFQAREDLRGVGCLCLVDDVVTTGSTLEAAARALRRRRARRVVAVCVARTPEPR